MIDGHYDIGANQRGEVRTKKRDVRRREFAGNCGCRDFFPSDDEEDEEDDCDVS